jgi:hypothetical protein
MKENAIEEIERRFWTEGEEFFDHYLAEEAVMVFPPPFGVLGRESVLESLHHFPRWTEVEMEEVQIMHPTADTVGLIYRVRAGRPGMENPYHALVSSLYLWEKNHWKLVLHQQTPFAPEASG